MFVENLELDFYIVLKVLFRDTKLSFGGVDSLKKVLFDADCYFKVKFFF